MVSPRTCPNETTQDNKGSLEGSDDKIKTKEKPRENVVLPELSHVGLTGHQLNYSINRFENLTSTCRFGTCRLERDVNSHATVLVLLKSLRNG